jgi:putative ABC transport system permease protein
MLFLVLRQLRFEWGRTGLTILAIGAVIAEILILEGFLAGLYSQLRQAVLNRGGDLIVTQAGISNFIATRSILPQTARLQIEQIEGVREADPLTGLSVIYGQNGRRTPIIVLVYDTAGGPTEIIAGRPIEGDREIVVDRALAIKYGLSPGDSMLISDFEFKVSGISTNSAAFLTPFAFITYDDLIDFYLESDIAADIATFPLLSFLLVKTEANIDPRVVAARIEERVKVADAFLPEEIAQKDENLGRELLGPILGLLLVVSYVIGVLVVSMFMFAAVRGRQRNLGVLKALGFRPHALGIAVLFEAFFLISLALPIGVLLALGIAEIIDAIAPIYLILAAKPIAIVRTAAVCLIFAVLGALVPVRAIAHIDPAIVFKN